MSAAPRFPVAVDSGGPLGAFSLSQSVLDHAPIGMLITVAGGEIVWANAAMNDVLGVEHTRLTGDRFPDYVHPQDRAALRDDVAALVAGGALSGKREFRWVNADGSERWVSAHASLALNERGEALAVAEADQPCVIHQLLDITEHRLAQGELAAAHRELQERSSELERSNEELTQFAYVASHDLSEPLRVIAGHVELLARRYDDQLDDTAREWISFAVDGCARMRILIDDLLRYSRVGREVTRVPVSLNDVLTTSQDRLAPALQAANAHLDVGDLPVVTGDANALTQLFSNLLANAVKYASAEHPPAIRVFATRTQQGWAVSVADNGPGIPAHQRDRIFRIFQRLHGRETPGTGIGLAICRKVVETHGGTIAVTDTPGGGATFTVTLPDGDTMRA